MLGIFSYLYLFLYRVLQNMQKFIVNYSHLTVGWNLSLCSVSVKHYSTYLFPETFTNSIYSVSYIQNNIVSRRKTSRYFCAFVYLTLTQWQCILLKILEFHSMSWINNIPLLVWKFYLLIHLLKGIKTNFISYLFATMSDKYGYTDVFLNIA